MADTNDKPHTPPLTTIALDEHGVILLDLDAKPLAIHDTITEHLGQLRAMFTIVYGDCPCPLNQLNDPLNKITTPIDHSHIVNDQLLPTNL